MRGTPLPVAVVGSGPSGLAAAWRLKQAGHEVWHNMDSFICSTRWTWGDRVGQGDTQEVQWSDYIRTFTGDPTGVIAGGTAEGTRR